MTFLIADTFTDGLARLTGEEQKAVKTTAFDLQLNPADPGMRFLGAEYTNQAELLPDEHGFRARARASRACGTSP